MVICFWLPGNGTGFGPPPRASPVIPNPKALRYALHRTYRRVAGVS
jgi:hypothetical protein